jgi:hypothetical protein
LELLVASSILAVVLSAAYGWVWSVASLATAWDDRAQARTIVAAVVRTAASDVHAAVAALPPSGRDQARSLLLVHDRADSAAQEVLLVWDPVRCVLWRNASGTYVADRVVSFHVGYFLSDGRRIDGGFMAAADWGDVRAVCLEIEARVGDATAHCGVELSLGPA